MKRVIVVFAILAASIDAASDFPNGAAVRVSGLKNLPRLNGRLGKVVGYDDYSQRYTISVAGSEFAVRSSHLTLAEPQHAAPKGIRKLNSTEANPAKNLFESGSAVELYGLKEPSLNGQVGVVQGLDLDLKPPKYIVKLVNGQLFKVSPKKLRMSRSVTPEGKQEDEAAEELSPGQAVEAFGLRKLGNLNGQVGMVQGKDPQNGRFVVAFSDKPYALQRKNLRVALLQ